MFPLNGYVLLLALSAANLAQAGEQLVYSTNVAPFFYATAGQAAPNQEGAAGAVNELLYLAARRTGVTLDVRALPFNRLRALVGAHPETLAVMWRLPEIEASRIWLGQLFSEQLVIIVRQDGAIDAGDVESAKRLRVGVVSGGPAEMAVRRLGFVNVEAAISAESNARKLALGRIDAWVGFRSVAAATQRQIGSSMNAMRVGAVLQDVELYLSCGLNANPPEIADWRQAFEQLRKEGVQQELLHRYQLTLAPN